jgi:hypothetical protein
MRNNMYDSTTARIARLGVFAGLAGGGAEIVWIMLYAAFSGTNAVEVARAVALVASGGLMDSVLAGITIHMVFAAVLGIALAVVWRHIPVRLGVASEYGIVLLALTAVWKINFFVLLPLISPSFVNLLPYAATLVSKLLFGFAAAVVLSHDGALQLRRARKL